MSRKWIDVLGSSDAGGGQSSRQAKCTVDVPVTTLDQMIYECGMPYYVKIDVEGFELEVIWGLSQAVPLLSVECNLPHFCNETLEIVKKLSDLSSLIRFNFVTTEPPLKFEADDWLEANEIIPIVESGRHTYLELYARPVS